MEDNAKDAFEDGLEEFSDIIDDSDIIDVEVILENIAEKTEATLEALPYALNQNTSLATGQEVQRMKQLEKTMVERFNCPDKKWKQFLHPTIREKFLQYVREKGSLTGALVKLRLVDHFSISASAVGTLLARFPTLALMYEEATEEYNYILEGEAHRRAVEGVEEDVYHQGAVCGTKKNYSDSLLSKLLEANVAKFKKTGGAGGNTKINMNGPIQVNINRHFTGGK